MIKAICFDFFNTLTYYHPSREQVYIDVCAEHKITVNPKALARSLPSADMYWRNENRRSPIDKRGTLRKFLFFIKYITMAVNGTGTKINWIIALQIMLRMRKINWEFKIYDDCIDTMKRFRERGVIIGLVSNIDSDINDTCARLGLTPYLDIIVTSGEVGSDKPSPEIFQTALKKAHVKAEETIFVGDQYHVDVVGARGVGMQAVLVDRNDWFDDITDCPRIKHLSELTRYLQ